MYTIYSYTYKVDILSVFAWKIHLYVSLLKDNARGESSGKPGDDSYKARPLFIPTLNLCPLHHGAGPDISTPHDVTITKLHHLYTEVIKRPQQQQRQVKSRAMGTSSPENECRDYLSSVAICRWEQLRGPLRQTVVSGESFGRLSRKIS